MPRGRPKKIENLFNPTNSVKKHNATPIGSAGFDNVRENIDPHIKTGVISSKQIDGTPEFTSFSQGSVLFIGSDLKLSENNSNLFWDNTNNFLGIGVQTPINKLGVGGGVAIGVGYAGIYTAATNGLLVQGKTGIGNNAPASMNALANQLVVGDGSTHQGITIHGGTTTRSSIHFADGTVGDQAYRGIIYYDHNVDAMVFYGNGTAEWARFNSSGYLGIGTNAPGKLFDVNNVFTIDGEGRIDNTGTYSTSGVGTDDRLYDVQLNITSDTAASSRYPRAMQIIINTEGTTDFNSSSQVYALNAQTQLAADIDVGAAIGLQGRTLARNGNNGTIGYGAGLLGEYQIQSGSAVTTTKGVGLLGRMFIRGSTTMTDTVGLESEIKTENTRVLTTTNLYYFKGTDSIITDPVVTNFYGLYLPDITAGTNSYGIYTEGGINYLAGDTGIGTNNPSEALDVIGDVEISGLTADKAVYTDLNKKLISIDFLTPSTQTVNTGTLTSGTVTDVQTWSDGNDVHLTEVTGVPGFDVEYRIDSVTNFYEIEVAFYYVGSTTHECKVQIYDDTNTAWVDMLSQSGAGLSHNTRFIKFPGTSSDFINASNQVKIRFYHPQSGNASHDLYIDYVSIIGY